MQRMSAAADLTAYPQLAAELTTIRTQARGEPAQALARLERLQARYRESGHLLQEMGLVQLGLGQRAAALLTLRRAVKLNDALPESWDALTGLHRELGQNAAAHDAGSRAAQVRAMPAELRDAAVLLHEGEITQADELTRRFLRRVGAHAVGMRLLAQICTKAGVHDDAELLLEQVLALEPDNVSARFDYASVLTYRRIFALAAQTLAPLLQADPRNVEYRKLQAAICDGVGDLPQALAIYRQLAAESPDDPDLPVLMGFILKATGDTAQAIELFEAALGVEDTFPEACLALAHLDGFTFSETQLARMRAVESDAATAIEDRARLCFALGRVLETRSAYADSFACYERGNAVRRSQQRVDPEISIRTMQRQPQVCTAEFFAARRGFGCPRPDPIFIVGMPRSGSTLIEQILASHSQIDGTRELTDLQRLVHQFRNRKPDEPPRYPAILADLTPEECRQLGETYIEDTLVHRRGAAYFLDKLPNNFRDIGFIHLILPNARIIDARREPLACCFGNFKQLFPPGMEFMYTLSEVGRYYCQYVALMGHWQRVLPRKILRVDHEDVVNDLEGSVRRMLRFLGLPFEPACLEFHRTHRAVRTMSAGQVRQPINRAGLEQWRHYEPWLGPLKRALAPVLPGNALTDT
jgi:tetratricopeptide (TPR) repeat protein